MRAQEIPTAEATHFPTVAKHFVTANGSSFPVVIKADGLALGKGVIIAPMPRPQGRQSMRMMSEGRFGDAGRRIVIEEFLRGSDARCTPLVDGKNYRCLNRRAIISASTMAILGRTRAGWARSVRPTIGAPSWKISLINIMRPLLRGLHKEGITFRGLLYPVS